MIGLLLGSLIGLILCSVDVAESWWWVLWSGLIGAAFEFFARVWNGADIVTAAFDTIDMCEFLGSIEGRE